MATARSAQSPSHSRSSVIGRPHDLISSSSFANDGPRPTFSSPRLGYSRLPASPTARSNDGSIPDGLGLPSPPPSGSILPLPPPPLPPPPTPINSLPNQYFDTPSLRRSGSAWVAPHPVHLPFLLPPPPLPPPPPPPPPLSMPQDSRSSRHFDNNPRHPATPSESSQGTQTHPSPPPPPPPPPPILSPTPHRAVVGGSGAHYATMEPPSGDMVAARSQGAAPRGEEEIHRAASSMPTQPEKQSWPALFPSPSATREQDKYFEEETASSEDDLNTYEFLTQKFPPLLPTVGSRLEVARQRQHITGKIKDWVARYERQSPARSGTSEPSSLTSDTLNDDEAQKKWAELKDTRRWLVETKEAMAASRMQLRELRRLKDEADNAFMGLLRPIIAKSRAGITSVPDDNLERRFREMQTLRTEYHSAESAYEGLELALDGREEYVKELEVKFFSFLAAGHTTRARRRRPGTDQGQNIPRPNVPLDLLGISSESQLSGVDPLWNRLVSAMGDINLAEEELEDLLFIRGRIAFESDLKLKENTGRELSEEDREFLEDFPAEERQRRERLEEATEEARRLRALCRERGAELKHPSFAVTYALGRYDLDGDALGRNIGEDMVLDSKLNEPGSLRHFQFPEILSQPDHVLRSPLPLTPLNDLKEAVKMPEDDYSKETRMRVAIKEYGIQHTVYGLDEDTNEYADSSRSFVTRWLLYQLRTCPLEAEILLKVFCQETNLKIVDYHSWELDVLDQWWEDDAAKPLPGERPSSGSYSMRGHIRSPRASRTGSELLEDDRLRFSQESSHETSTVTIA